MNIRPTPPPYPFKLWRGHAVNLATDAILILFCVSYIAIPGMIEPNPPKGEHRHDYSVLSHVKCLLWHYVFLRIILYYNLI